MTKQEAITKAKKIKALADRGSTIGERDTAKHKLTEFMKIHNLTDQDLSGSHSYSYKPSEPEFSKEFFERMRREKADREKRRQERQQYRATQRDEKQHEKSQHSSHSSNNPLDSTLNDPDFIAKLERLGQIIFNAYRRR